MRKATRVSGFPRSGIRKMSAMAMEMDDVVTLCIGEPDFDTPHRIVKACERAMEEGYTHYPPSGGYEDLRSAVAQKYSKKTGIDYGLENVIITSGSTQGLFHTFFSTLNPGDEVIVPDPYYPNYLGQFHLAGVNVRFVPVREESGFRLQVEDLEKTLTSKTKAILINSPNNPTGAVLEEEDLVKIADFAIRNDLVVVSDEVYDEIIYDGRKYSSIASIPEMKERVVINNGFSKTYAMTGWRLGYVLAPAEYVSSSVFLQESFISCGPAFIQRAALEALNGPQKSVAAMLEKYSRRRSLIIEGLNDIPGVSCLPTSGAFYAFPNIKEFGKSSEDFAVDLLKKAGVATVPGSYFGANGEGYLRLSYATSDENIREALKRFKQYVQKYY